MNAVIQFLKSRSGGCAEGVSISTQTNASSTAQRCSTRMKVARRIATGLLFSFVALTFLSGAVSAQVFGSASLNVGRAGHSATRLGDGRILIAGGENAGGALSTAELYDPTTGQWTPTGSMSVPRIWHTATLLNNGQVLEQLMAGEFGPNVWRLAVSRSSPAMYDPVIIEEETVQATLTLRLH